MATNNVERSTTQINEMMKLSRRFVATVDYVRHI
jgi:hypothetical protein